MDVPTIKQLLSESAIAPLKSRGQHFLINERSIEQIVHVAKVTQYDTIVEIGPGLGVLTEALAKRAKHVIAVDIDKGFVNILKRRLQDRLNITIVHADILKFRLTTYDPRLTTYAVIGNLPYNLTSKILEKFLQKERQKPELMVITVQKEFAKRMIAKPPRMNRLALLCQYYGKPEIAATFPPHFFWPQPKVHSHLVKIDVTPHNELPLNKRQGREMMKIIRQAFSQPRKKLKNSLGLQVTGYALQDKRPGELTLNDWVALLRSM